MKTRRLIIVAAVACAAFLTLACPFKAVDPDYSARIMNALNAMRPGDWALYYLKSDLQFRLQVVERDSEGVVMEYLMYFRNAPHKDPTRHRFNFRDVERNLEKGLDLYGRIPFLEMKKKQEPTRAGDRMLESEHWAIRTDGAVIEQWLSDEVPVWGIVRQRRNAKNTMLVRAWGRAGEKFIYPRDLAPIPSATEPPSGD